MIVLFVLGWILLGLLALFVLALLLPAAIRVQFSPDGLFVWVRVLCLRKRVFPLSLKPHAKPKKEKRAKHRGASGEDETSKKQKKERTFAEKVAFAKRLARAGMAATRVVLHHMRIKGIQVVLPVHAAEASGTALLAGRVQGGIGALRAALGGRLKLYFKRLQIIPDFTGQRGGELFLACKVVFNPVIMFKAGFVFLRVFRRRRPCSKMAFKRAIAQKKARASGVNAA